jgi:hypothetical protein
VKSARLSRRQLDKIHISGLRESTGYARTLPELIALATARSPFRAYFPLENIPLMSPKSALFGFQIKIASRNFYLSVAAKM